MKKANLQDIFLTKVRKQAVPVTVFLMNGFQLRGVITGFDSFSLVLDSDGRQQFIYKLHPCAPAPSLPAGGGRGRLTAKEQPCDPLPFSKFSPWRCLWPW